MSTTMADIIRSGADLCLEFRDGITNRMIEAERVDVRVQRNHMPLIFNKIVKNQRFILLCGIGQGQIEMMVQAENYEEKHCTVFIGKNVVQKAGEATTISDYVYTDFGIPVLALCLYPGEDYPLPEDYVRKSIQGKPFELIRAVIDARRPLILLEDYQGGDILKVSAGEKVVGGFYRIKGRDGQFEDFVAVAWQEKEQMIPGAELSGKYPKGSRIYFLYEAVADAEGNAVVICRERS